MLVIRLTRTGSKKRATYRVIVAESRTPRDSSVVESLGYYNPRTSPATLKVDHERVSHWLGVGAQPSSTVKTLLKKYKEPVAVATAPAAAAVQ